MIIQEPVQAAIWHCLNHYDHKNAVFLAERLCSEVENDETVFLLATSYFRSNLVHQALWLLKEKARLSPQCRFLQAKCAFALKNYKDAESALDLNGFSDPKYLDELANEMGDVACFALELVAQICMRTDRLKMAAAARRRALKLNPFMWRSFVDLCDMGEDVEPAAVFNITSTDVFNTCQGNVKSNTAIIFGAAALSATSDSGGGLSQQNLVNSQYTLETLMNITNSNSYILSTPVDQQFLPHNLITPNNDENKSTGGSIGSQLNSSMAMLRGGTAPNKLPNTMLEDTPIGYVNESTGVCTDATTPYRKKFKYLSAFSPTTPSFGILPLNSPQPCALETPQPASAANQQNGSTVSSPLITPSPQKLAENLEPKIVINKRIRHHTSNLIGRKETMAGVGGTARSGIFAQTGNLTPRTPNNSVNITSPGHQNAAVRRSSRLFGNSAVKENNKSPNVTTGKFAQPRSPARKPKTRMSKIGLGFEIIDDKVQIEKLARKDKEKIETVTLATSNMQTNVDDKVQLLANNNTHAMMQQLLSMKKQSADGLMNLLRDLAEGYKFMSIYQCKAAIKHFERNIPKHHLSSSWVQSQIGRAYYELTEYEDAITVFKQVHETEPHRLEYMEFYSSSLWQVQNEVDLSSLARDFMDQDKMSAVTWCALGNCFSLQKEHDTAIKYFKRAVQVDPDFVYSYTLLGHELVLIEDLDKAMQYFQAAVEVDRRHYHAWFGIATVYSKQEKHELAELHFMKAFKINPQNSVILVHIGAMQFFMKKQEQALSTLSKAAAMEPKNSLARFHRASILFTMRKYTEALQELEPLKECVPKESVVFYLLGRIHKALGNVHLALMNFSCATELDPKGTNNQIKDAYDSMANTIDSQPNEHDLESLLDTSEQSDESTQAQQDVNYESDF